MNKCKICEKEFSRLSFPRHFKGHKIKSKEYYDKYLRKEGEGICGCGKEATFYGIYKGYAKSCSSKCQGKYQSNTRIEYWLRKTNGDMGKAEQLLKERQSTIREDKMGSEKLEEYKKKRSYLSSKEYYTDRFGEEEGNKKWKDLRERSAVTVENMIRLYGEVDGNKKYNEWVSNSRLTIDTFINKYGEDEGTKKYKEKNEKWKKSFFGTNAISRGVSELQLSLCADIKDNGIPLEYYGDNEVILTDEIEKIYLYDITYGNKIIEVQGDYWHCNPNTYKPTDIHPTSKKSAKDIWERDNCKKKFAESLGYEVMYVWESEYRNNKKETIDKVLDFLKK